MSLFLPEEYLDDIFCITPAFLRERGIRVLICDIDNTLEPYEEPVPTEKTFRWLKEMEADGVRFALVSNNHDDRVSLFNRDLGYYMKADAHKPLPGEVRKALRALNASRREAALLGDQIFTDVLAGHVSGMRAILVKPIRDKKTAAFRFKRALEKPLLKLWKMCRERSK